MVRKSFSKFSTLDIASPEFSLVHSIFFISSRPIYDLNGSNKLKSAAIEFHQEHFGVIFQESKCSEFNEILYYNKLTILLF